MPDRIFLALNAFITMTDDAVLVVDPQTLTLRCASPRAVDLIGPILQQQDVPASHIFGQVDDFAVFIADALTVTEPIISSVSVLPDARVLIVKARRLAVQDGVPLVLLLLEAESELSSRFRLLTEKIEELRGEVGRRVAAEQELSETIFSLRQSVAIIRQIAELDISSGDYLEMAAGIVCRAFETRGTAILTASVGKLQVMATTKVFAETIDDQPFLDLTLTEFTRLSREQTEEWKDRLFSSLQRVGAEPVDFENALVFRLWVAGECRGALICLLEADAQTRTSLRLEGDIISESLGGLIARAEIEARLMHAQKFQAIGELTGGIAHDFNNILAVVLGNAELLLDEMDNLDIEVAGEIRDAAMRGATLNSRLLSFARKQPLAPKPTDANKLLREFDPLIRRTIKENIDYELISAGGLWKTQVDQNQLENAVLNLAVNARDAMPDGGRLTIETANTRLDPDYADRHSEVEPGQYVMIAVSDTGHGMESEVLQEAFTPFFTTKEVGKGSGLGLSMVFGFVKQSLGHVKIYSEPDLGTTVRMYFPRDPVELKATDKDLGERVKDQTLRRNGRILVVEDDRGVLSYLKKSLEKLGYDVEVTTTGDSASEYLKEQPYDVLLTDVVLPGRINGAQLAKIANQIAPKMPVLFMSGYTENSIVHHGRLDPGVDFISKPFTREQLAKRLRDLMGG